MISVTSKFVTAAGEGESSEIRDVGSSTVEVDFLTLNTSVTLEVDLPPEFLSSWNRFRVVEGTAAKNEEISRSEMIV